MNVAIIGAGGWGTALACVLAANEHQALLWAHNPKIAEEINQSHTNSTYLSGITIPETILATSDTEAINKADIAVLTVPTQYVRQTLETFHFNLNDKIVVSGSKGIEQHSLLRVSELLQDIAGVDSSRFVALTGPSHAEEVSRNVPTTVVAASESEESAQFVQKLFSTSRFRVYSSHDVIGVELGGALKNIIAISAGIIDGLGYGDNTKAALMTRGLAEITRLGVALGANPLTFSGLSGLGDLIVTCTSRHSRNRWVGEQIGKGKTLGLVLQETKKVAEGVNSTASASELAARYEVEMPIVEQVHAILFDDKPPQEAIQELMLREAKPEYWW